MSSLLKESKTTEQTLEPYQERNLLLIQWFRKSSSDFPQLCIASKGLERHHADRTQVHPRLTEVPASKLIALDFKALGGKAVLVEVGLNRVDWSSSWLSMQAEEYIGPQSLQYISLQVPKD